MCSVEFQLTRIIELNVSEPYAPVNSWLPGGEVSGLLEGALTACQLLKRQSLSFSKLNSKQSVLLAKILCADHLRVIGNMLAGLGP